MKILLVDDHALFREGVGLLLTRLNATVAILEAGDCDQAFRVVAEDSNIDLVLLDLGLPGMPGLEGLTIMREKYPALPIVVLSSSEDRGDVLSAIDGGAMGFIPKTSSSDVMLAALRLTLANGIYLPPSVFLSRPAIATPHVRSINNVEKDAPPVTPRDLGLTPRQSEVLFLVLQGKSAKLICRELGLSPSTVKVHTSAALRALNVTTRTQAVVAASKLGLQFTSPGELAARETRNE